MNLYQFIEEHIDFSGIKQEKKEELIKEIAELILEGAFIRVLDDAEEEKVQAMEKILEEDHSTDFFVKKMNEYFPQFQKILQEELEYFQSVQ